MSDKDSKNRAEIERFMEELELVFKEAPRIFDREVSHITNPRPQRIVGGQIVND